MLEEQGIEVSEAVIFPRKRDGSEPPLSFAQQRLWFLDRLEPGTAQYNIPVAVRIAGDLDEALFEQSINAIVQRHEVLRTSFSTREGAPVQRIGQELHIGAPVVDLTLLAADEAQRESHALIDAESMRPFDLEKGPLVRAILFKAAEHEHIVLFLMHHIVSDGWSMGVFTREILAVYEALRKGRPSPLSPLPIQYADFALWQRRQLRGDELNEQLEYWKARLDKEGGVLELPTDRPRPSLLSSRGASYGFEVPSELGGAIRALARREDATLFMTMLAAFQTLLYLYTGSRSIQVGVPFAGRSRAELEDLIGFFVNTLVLRTEFEGDPAFREILLQVRKSTIEAYSRQNAPFEMLVEKLRLERSTSRTPLFQVMFTMQNASGKPRSFAGLSLSAVETHTRVSNFELTLSVEDDAAELRGAFEYSTDLFNAATIARMAAHFRLLLEGIAENPDRNLSTLRLLTRLEQRSLLREWNDTSTEFPEGCLHHLLEARAEESPEAVALLLPGDRERAGEWLSYGALNRRANRLANCLRKLGVGPEVPVGICLERSLEMIVGMLGILKAGGCYVPLDPDYPPERLAFMAEDSGIGIVLTQERLRRKCSGLRVAGCELKNEGSEFNVQDNPELATPNSEHPNNPQPATRYILCIDTDWPVISQEPDRNPDIALSPDNLAYLIYTSGSTGKPKGVMVHHRAVVNHNAAVSRQFRLHCRDRVLQFANISFDGAVEEIFPTLLSGATVVLRPSGVLPTLEMISEWIETEGITVLDLPTAYWHELVSQREHCRRPVPRPLRLLVVGGEEPSGERLAAWQEFAGADREWMNTYGPTEATVIAASFTAGPETWDEGAKIPVGRPIANARVHVLDGSLKPVPGGGRGELHIGGAGVARGYLGRPDLTAEKFIPDPFEAGGQPDQGGERLYRTGDLGRFLPDGNVEFLGRMDEQVKVRGFRVELSEIEAALRRHPSVEEAAVLAREAEPGGKQLAAYVAGKDLEAARLRSFLKDWLPDYMIPSAFVIMEALPLTPSGKVNRRALPAPDRSIPESGHEGARTAVEEILGRIFAHVLGVKEVGIHDNFFDLGGHSLLATQVISRLPGALGIELPLRTVFETPTVAGLSEAVEKARLSEHSVPIPPIQAISRGEDLTLSFAQQRLWFLDQLEPENPFYNIPDAVRISGPLDTAVLERCFNEIIHRHEALRTAFKTIGGRPVQVILPELKIRLEVIDLGHLDKARREEEALRMARRAAQAAFDLTKPPLLRAQVLRLTEQEHILLFILHHIVGDNWSMGVLIRETALLYSAFQRGEPSPLSELPIQYADFAHWQREWLRGEVLESQLQYWRKQLEGLPPLLELPTDRPRPPVQTFPGAYRSFAFSAELSDRIRRLCMQKAATTFMVLLAGFQALLHRYTGLTDICVGSPIANRNRREIENLIGFFINTLALRTDLSDDPTFGELLARVRETALGAYAHQDLPFEMIVDALQPQRNMSHSPLFQVVFALQTAPGQTGIKPDSFLTLHPVEIDSGTAKFDLTLFMAEEGDRIGGAMEYNTDLFDSATIHRMLNHFEELLTGAVSNPDRRLSELPVLTEPERRQLLLLWGDTRRPSPESLVAHELFEDWAANAPDAVALSDAGGTLTYAELNWRANRVAVHLRESGVGPESVVGLCAERSLEMATGMLGILKAGGAYLPLDPDYPQERLAFMVEDSGVQIILTQEKFRTKCCGLRVAGGGLKVEGSEFSVQDNPELGTRNPEPPHHPRPASRNVLCLDADWPTISHECDENPIVDVSPSNLAYVIYTSGSTGRPKGVGIEHKGLLNLIAWHRSAFSVSPAERATQVAAPGFDASVWEIWPYITSGASVHIPDEAVRAVPSLLKDWLLERDITISFLPTPMAEAVLALEWPRGAALRTLLTGGDRLHHFPSGALPFELVNNYGPTENTVVATSGVIHADGYGMLPPIGRAVANTRLYVLGPYRNLAPIGTAGELHIAGQSLARCYIRRPELTAEKFVPNPFEMVGGQSSAVGGQSSQGGERLYRTGDLVRFLPDGAVEFLGRIDHQVKLRGFRIELGEIESVMKSHPGIKDAAALVREDKPGDKRLIAYVAAKEKHLNSSEIREFLKARLPDYMVPSIFVAVESLPLNASGKVDRKALPLPDLSRPDRETEYAAPRTPEEETLARIWTEILGVDRVGIHDNFFELGGDSILSIQVVARANQHGLRLTPKELFLNPTVAGSAAVARSRHAVPPEQSQEQGPVPLTPIQRWFFEQDFPEPHHWNQSLMLEMNEPPSASLLEKSIESLAEHHEALGLRFQPSPFTSRNASWEVQTGPGPETPFTWIDLSALPAVDVTPAIESLSAWVQGGLNLSSGPLFRVVCFDSGASRSSRLLIVLHHLATDAVSWRILLEDLHLAYGRLQQGSAISLPPRSTPFRQWARRLAEHAQSQTLKRELPYWQALSESACSRLPVDFAEGENSEATAQQMAFSLCEEETLSLLREPFSVYRIGVEEMLLAALVRAISRWTGARTLLVDLEGHGRETLFEDMDISRTVGWFTSLYPVALTLPGAGGLRETLIAMKEQLRKVPGKGLGYGLLRYLCTDAEAVAGMRSLPRPEISFNYLGRFGGVLPQASPFRPARESKGPERSPRGRMTHLLEVSAMVAEDRLQVEWVYSRNLYRPETIESLAADHLSDLRALIDHCRSPEARGGTPSDFDLAGLDQRKLDKVLAKLNQPKGGRKKWEQQT